jgi:hypothetical protein
MTEREKQIIEMAQQRWEGHGGDYSDGDVNIEDTDKESGAPFYATVSETEDTAENAAGGNGAYVLGWLWVSFEGTPFDKCRHESTEPETIPNKPE